MHARPFPLIPNIEEINDEEEIINIQGVRKSDTTSAVDSGDRLRRKKIKKSKKSEKEDVEASKAVSIQDELDDQKRVQAIKIKVGSSRVADEIDVDADKLIGSTAPTPQAPLSAPSTIGATTDLSISNTIRTTANESWAHSEAFCTDTI